MTHEAEFKRLEEFVEKLLTGYNNLKTECAELQVQIRQLTQEKEDLAETLAGLRQERQDIHSRVSGLIGRIEEWEKGAEAQGGSENEPEEGDSPDRKTTQPGEQALFQMAGSPNSENSF